MVLIDLIQILADGEDPYAQILEAASAIDASETLEVVAPFEPIVIYHIMENRGFAHQTYRTQQGGWRVVFQLIPAD